MTPHRPAVRISSLLSLLLIGSCAFPAERTPFPIPRDPDYDPLRVLVRWTAGSTGTARQAARDQVHGTTDASREYDDLLPRLELLEIDVTKITIEKAAIQLSDHQASEYAELNYYVRPLDVPNDQFFPQQWNMQNVGQAVGGHPGSPGADINAVVGWDVFHGSSDSLIAVIDTGVEHTHPDLEANIWSNPGEVAGTDNDDDGNGFADDVNGWDFYSNDDSPDDPEGHGTHVAGIIGAVGNNGIGVAGVNWQCRIMPLRFIGNSRGLTSDAISALQYAVVEGAKVSCNSWGDDDPSRALEEAIEAAGDGFGHVFVTSAGNRHSDNDITPVYPGSYDLKNIINVASVDHRDKLGAKSNWGLASVDLGAPGVYVLSTTNDAEYQVLSGTSMAAAHVAGVVAMVMAVHPDIGALEVIDSVLRNVRPVVSLGGRTKTGGVVDLRGAMQ